MEELVLIGLEPFASFCYLALMFWHSFLMLEHAQGFWMHLATFLAPYLENNASSLVPFSVRNGSGDGA